MKKKLLALLLAVVMILSLVPLVALATHGDGEDDHATNECQIDAYGGVNYFDADGDEASEEDFLVSISKTIAPTDTENEFIITLEVKTTQEVIENIIPPDVATVLVIDISSSMKWTVDGSTLNSGDRGTLWGNDNLAESINHDFYKNGTSRMAKAKSAAWDFLESYVAEANGASRFVSIVSFGSQAKIEQTWIDITNEGNMAAAKSAIDALYVYNDTPTGNGTQYTYLQGGLGLAQNLISMNNIKALDNRYVVTLTDGNPTYSKASLSNDSGKTATGAIINGANTNGSAVTGEDAVEYNANVRVARERAEAVADSIKSGGAKIYTVGLSLDATRTFNNYATTSPKAAGDMKKNATEWLTGYIASPATASDQYHYDAGNEYALKLAFGEISMGITEIWTRAWIVNDPMGDNIVWSPDNETDSWITSFSDGTLTWNLRRCDPDVSVDPNREGVTIYTYSYSYNVTLDTLAADFEAGTVYATNDPTTLTYRTLTMNDGNVLFGDMQTVDFEIPAVHGYAAGLAFTKVDENGTPLAGATFELKYYDDLLDEYISGEEGLVLFSDIPSGHAYTLAETSPPDGYKLDDTTYVVTVSYGALTIANWLGDNGSSFYEVDGQLYFTDDPIDDPIGDPIDDPIDDPICDLWIEKTIDGVLFAEWDVPDGIDLVDLISGISFYLYSVAEYGASYDAEDPCGSAGLSEDGLIKFSGLELENGWYAIVENFEEGSLAEELFEKVGPLYIEIIGNNGSTYVVESSEFDYDAFYTIVNGYGWADSRVLGYGQNNEKLNNNGDLFYIGVTNKTPDSANYLVEYTSFCANAGSKNFAGDSGLDCSGYYLAKTGKYNDFIDALNYIESNYGTLNTDNRKVTSQRAIAQTVIWALLGTVDVNDPLFEQTNLSTYEKAAVVDTLANYKGAALQGKIIDIVFLECNKHHEYATCQPQLVPVYGDSKFNNRTRTYDEQFGTFDVSTDIAALEEYQTQTHMYATGKLNNGQSLTSARDVIENGLVPFNSDDLAAYGWKDKTAGIGAQAGDYVSNWLMKNGKSENETLFKVDVASASEPGGVQVWIAERDGQDVNASLGYYFHVEIIDGEVFVTVDDPNILTIGDFNVNAWSQSVKSGTKEKDIGTFGNGLSKEFGSNGAYAPFRIDNKQIQAMAGWKNEYKNVVDAFIVPDGDDFFYLHVHMKDVIANLLDTNGQPYCKIDTISPVQTRAVDEELDIEFAVLVNGVSVDCSEAIGAKYAPGTIITVTLYINGHEFGTIAQEIIAGEEASFDFTGSIIVNAGNPVQEVIYCPLGCSDWK